MLRRRTRWVLLFGGLLAAVAAAGIRESDGAAQDAPKLVDVWTGVVAGVRMGDTAGQIERKLGRATFGNEFSPRRTRPFTGPLSIPTPDSIQAVVAQYGSHAFLVGSVGAYSLKTVAAGATTQRDVNIGEPLSTARREYRQARCGRYLGGEESAFEWCSARVGLNSVFFGGDPIASITVTRVGRPPRRPTSRVVDVRRGAYRGIALGTTARQVVARLGPAPKWRPDRDPALPLVRSTRPAFPPIATVRPQDVLRYPDVAYLLCRGRVYAILIGGNADGPRVNRLALMARLQAARRPYPALRCATRSRAESPGRFRFCAGLVRPARWLWLGDDSVAGIVLATAPLTARG